MSHKWKIFLKGPNLHEGTSNEDASSSKAKHSIPDNHEDGISIAEFYQEIINQPSSSSCGSKKSIPVQKRKLPKTRKPPVSHSPPPSFSQLLKWAQENNINELASALANHIDRVDLNEQDSFGWNILMVASCAGSEKCVKLLLEKGASWTAVDRKGLNAFAIAKKNHQYQVCRIIKEWEEAEEERRRQQREAEKNQQCNSISIDSDQSGHSNSFCEPCQSEISNRTTHEKSIAHLVSTNKDGSQRVHYGIPESNIGFQIMIKSSGWNPNSGLGPSGEGQKFPIKTVLKQDRSGLGTGDTKKQARITHFSPFDTAAVETRKPTKSSEERIERKVTAAKKEELKQKLRERRKEINFRREFEGF